MGFEGSSHAGQSMCMGRGGRLKKSWGACLKPPAEGGDYE